MGSRMVEGNDMLESVPACPSNQRSGGHSQQRRLGRAFILEIATTVMRWKKSSFAKCNEIIDLL